MELFYMRIVVPIKQVPETGNVRMDEETGTVIRQGSESIVNPLDLYSIELAIRLRETYGGQITAISMGPPAAVEALKEAIAMGIDSAVLISDRFFAGSDTWATSFVLSEAIKKIGDYDLIVCGERATDGDTGQVGPGIAAFLDMPVISYVSSLEQIENGFCKVKRMVEDGYEVLSCRMPLLLTVVKEVSDPRLPTLGGKLKAKEIEIPVWDSKFLGISQDMVGLKGSPTRVVKISKPQVTRQCQLVGAANDTAANDSADKFLEYLNERELI
jgi:electron transfer flavoprotein beta subunit